MMPALENVDEVMSKARSSSLRLIEQAERRFVDSVTGRGDMTIAQALKVIGEERPAVLDALEEQMKVLRAWILRGGTDNH
jgi:hypothetical protein